MKRKTTIPLFNHPILVLTWLLLVIGCDKNPTGNFEPDIPVKAKAALWIGSEGLFQQGNASLMYMNITENKSYPDVFSSINHKPLGDVLQSISIKDNLVYLVVNNSQKIEIINRSDFKSVGTITGFTSPRHIAFVNNEKAYVSEFYSTRLKIINPLTQTITGSVDVGGWQEEIRVVGHQLFVTVYTGNKVMVIDTQTDQITDSIAVGVQPAVLETDAFDRLWVGSGNGNGPAHVTVIQPSIRQIEKTFTLPSNTIRKIQTSADRNQVYVLCDFVYRIHINDTLPPKSGQYFLSAGGSKNNLYGMAVDPKTDDIYLSDVHDFQQASDILRYNKYGAYQGQFKAGINTGSFYFDHEP